jgi:nucleotide-binding universal stress UspA family protein
VIRFEQTTVVWCDGSPDSERAVAAATLEAARRGTGLVLLTDTPADDRSPGKGYLLGEPSGYLVAEGAGYGEEEPAGYLTEERAVAVAAQTDASVRLEVVYAAAASHSQLVDLAQRTGLVVVRGGCAVHGAWPVAWPAGDVLAAHLDCPLLLVDGPDASAAAAVVGHEPAVVAGLDMVHAAEPVLLTAAAEAVARSVELTLIHALDRSATLDPAALAEGWRRCRAALRSAHLPRGVPNRLVVSQEAPVTALLNRVGPRDLLVVGTGGGGGWAPHQQGPVCRGVVEAMPCDVMVVPPWRRGRPAFLDMVRGRAGRRQAQPEPMP